MYTESKKYYYKHEKNDNDVLNQLLKNDDLQIKYIPKGR